MAIVRKKKRNPVAQILRTPQYRKRVVQDKTAYNRKKDKKPIDSQDIND